ncbi:MAG TPA: phosphatidylglycerophosphatase A [Candidatus Didemnitutus sp.]|nr:phosphatidylglycerophosphatase A [Candidatus Didemnitutus sp.]
MKLKDPGWARRLPGKFVMAVATLGPLGRNLPAPGTWGSAAGLLYVMAFFYRASWIPTVLISIVVCYLAVGFTGEAARRMGREDPGEVNLDEFVVMPFVFLGWHAGYTATWPIWLVLAAGFALFRLFDILKPLGISRLQKLPGGWGIVVDDIAAAFAACVTLQAVAWLLRGKL